MYSQRLAFNTTKNGYVNQSCRFTMELCLSVRDPPTQSCRGPQYVDNNQDYIYNIRFKKNYIYIIYTFYIHILLCQRT